MRKKSIVYSGLGLLSAFMALGTLKIISSTPSMMVSSGSSRSYVASSTSVVEGTINSGDLRVSGGVHGKGSSLSFDETCDENSKTVGKTKVNNLATYGVSNLLSASFAIGLTEIKDGGRFSIAFGLPSVSSSLERTGVTEIRFSHHDGGYFVSALDHLAEGATNSLLSERNFSGLGPNANLKVKISVSTANKIDFLLNGSSLLEDVSIQGNGEGYFGFFSNKKNVLTVGDLLIYGHSYSSPENVDYFEDFDNGAYNAKVFTSSSSAGILSPSYLQVDNGALHFCNTGPASFTTMHMYSNFELEFQIPQLAREATYDENGNIVGLVSNWFGIAWGVDSPRQLPESTPFLAQWLQFEPMSCYGKDHTKIADNKDYFPRLILWDKTNALKVQSMGFNIYEPQYAGKTIDLKLTLIDGVMKCYGKISTTSVYSDPLMVFDLGETKDGYVRIFTWNPNNVDELGLSHSATTNFTIDNFHIINRESPSAKKTIADVGYQVNGIDGAEDYPYRTKTDDNDLIKANIKRLNSPFGDRGFLPLIISLAGGGVLLIGGGLGITFAVKKKGGKKR